MLRLTALVLLAAALSAQTPAPGRFDLSLIDSKTGNRLTGASVTFEGPGQKIYSGKTGDDGHFRLADLPPGVYTIRSIAAPGFVLAQQNVLSSFSIYAGQTRFHSLNYVPSPLSATIQGTVTDEDGNPIEGAIVVSLRAPANTLEATATTDARGFYSMPGSTPTGLRMLSMKAYVPRERALQMGRAFQETSYPHDPAVRWPKPDLTKPEVVDFTLHSSPTFHVRGRVTGVPASAESPVVSISDCGQPLEESRNAIATLRDDGSFDATAIRPGFYCVRFEMTERSTQARRLFPMKTMKVSDRDIDQVELVFALPQF